MEQFSRKSKKFKTKYFDQLKKLFKEAENVTERQSVIPHTDRGPGTNDASHMDEQK